MNLGVGGHTMSKSCPMTRSRLPGCHKHVFFMLRTYFSQVLMAVKDCSAMGTILRRGTGVTQKVQFYTFMHILTLWWSKVDLRGWKFDPKVKIWSWWEIDFWPPRVEIRSCDLTFIPPQEVEFMSCVRFQSEEPLILLSIAKFNPKMTSFDLTTVKSGHFRRKVNIYMAIIKFP